MKDLTELKAYRLHTRRVLNAFGSYGDATCGAFELPYPRTGVTLLCVASTGEGWDHVSVSLPNRCPNWYEMEFIKDAFFLPNESAMQLHVSPVEHIRRHPNCLHLWRPNDGREIPRPVA